MSGAQRRDGRKSRRMSGRETTGRGTTGRGTNGWGMNGWGMNKETQSIVVALLGGLLLSITLSGRFTSYVRPGFKPLLLIGGGILVIVGVVSLILAIRADLTAERSRKAAAVSVGGPPAAPGTDDDEVLADAHGHDHATSKAPWLILLPVLVLLLVAPPALGADAVARNASSQGLAGYDVVVQGPAGSKDGAGGSAGGYKFNDGSGSATDSKGSRRTMHFPALEGTDPSMTIKEFVLRALYDADNSVQDTPVTVTGFIAPAGDGYTGGYTIARMVISCCAADANPMQLHIAGAAPLPSNTWVNAVVTVVPDTANLDNGYVPTVTLTSMTTTNQPDDPYEH
jgi:uncharacterized repeat protein (TIGR03943 family)